MKKAILMFVAVLSLAACKKEDANKYSTDQLVGVWQFSDAKRPDGSYSSDVSKTEKQQQVYDCVMRTRYKFTDKYFSLFGYMPSVDYYGNINCQSNNLRDIDYTIKGDVIQVFNPQNPKESMKMFHIVSVTENILELKIHEEMKQIALGNIRLTPVDGENLEHSMDWYLKGVIILKKVR